LKTNRRSDGRPLLPALLVLGAILGGLSVPAPAGQPLRADSTADSLTFARLIAFASDHGLAARPFGELVAAVGGRFLGSSYREGTLGRTDDEPLIVNLREFDCVTFVETALALARTIRHRDPVPARFRRELENLRYRGGVRSGYASRLHYFSEWMSDNAKKGLIDILTDSLGGRRISKPVTFLSRHGPCADGTVSDATVRLIRGIEHRLTADSLCVIPASALASVSGSIRDGDIIAFATSLPGLDVGHTGIAVRDKKGAVHLLHASEKERRVVLTRQTLAEYLASHRRDTGILIARPRPVPD